MSIFDPKKLSEDLNPYRDTVKLSPEQQEAKRQADGRLMFKRLKKFLSGLHKKRSTGRIVKNDPPKKDE